MSSSSSDVREQVRLKVAKTRLWLVTAAVAALMLSGGATARAQGIVVKMATLVPDGSAWHGILKEMAEEWKTATGGAVTMRIYAGGVAGDDVDVVRKIRLGTLNGGLLSSSGLADVDRSVNAMQIPMAYADYAEFDAVLAQVGPTIAETLGAKGFVLLDWVDGGWVTFFTRSPVTLPDDLKKLKLFSWAGDTEAVEIWKSAGFNPVPLPSTEISTALQTGLITAVSTTPQATLLLGWFNQAKNMTDLNWGVLLGGIVVSKATWEKIPEAARPALLESARKAGTRLRQETRRREGEDIAAMRARGLNVVGLDAAAVVAWRTAAESAYPRIRGGFVPAPAFDRVMAARDAYRREAAAKP
jgi:TRAP-type C4-dicarboxylate transport system substrate-binding protein